MTNSIRKLLIFSSIVLSSALTIQNQAHARQVHDEKPIELSGFSISEAYEIEDDQPLDVDAPIIEKLLYRIKKTSPKSRQKYSQFSQAITWDQIAKHTEDHRLWVFDRKATLKKIEKRQLAKADEDSEIKGVFVCHCANENGDPFVALARTIPRGLQVNVPLDETVGVSGFLFARASISHDRVAKTAPQPVFVTDRLAWFPNQQSDDASASHVLLAKHGVDIGLFDFVRNNNTRPLGSHDAEAFFQLLAAAGQMEDKIGVTPELGFEDLMRNANSNFGQCVRINGIVRTCSEIHVDDSDIQDRLGLSKYYQLMLFPDLDGAKIIVKNKNGEQLDYRRFPVTICCTKLPNGMTPTDVERKQFLVEGFFFRFWKYQSDKTDQAGITGQVSPLIITNYPIPVETDEGRLDSILFVFFVAVIVGIAALIYGFRIADRKRKSPAQQILADRPDRIDLAGLEE